MSKRCHEKKQYASREAAEFFARCDGLRAYRCPVCGAWHLTSQNLRVASVRAPTPDSEGEP